MIRLNRITLYILKATRNQQVGQVVKSPAHINRLLLYTAHLGQQCHNSKLVIFQDKRLKFLKFFSIRATTTNCSPAVSFTNCVVTLYLLKMHLQTFLSIPITQKCQILSCETLVANERCMKFNTTTFEFTFHAES